MEFNKAVIKNPIIPGFNPDPSICRVGEDYYIVCSSFELYPGLPIYHSRDLINWSHIGNAMNEENSFHIEYGSGMGGLMAPTIRYHDGKFYIINFNFQKNKNYIISADNAAGPWSFPIWLDDVPNIDASIFFDNDGAAYIVGTGNVWDNGKGSKERGIWIARFDLKSFKLVGEKVTIFNSAFIGAKSPEAPHIYHIGDYYYLIIAEGGTGNNHSVVTARSHQIFGWYENNPANPVLTHRNMGSVANIQNVGHADIIETPSGEWYAVMLASRTIDGPFKNLGRETFLCPVIWEDGWPFFSSVTGKLELYYEINSPIDSQTEIIEESNNIINQTMKNWIFLGTPYEKFYHIEEDSISLRCLQNNTLPEIVSPSFGNKKNKLKTIPFIGKRQQSININAETLLSFIPKEKEAAGLILLQAMNHQIRVEKTCLDSKQVIRVVKTSTLFNTPPHKPKFQYELVTEVLNSFEHDSPKTQIEISIVGQCCSISFNDGLNCKKFLLEKYNLSEIIPTKIAGMAGTLIGIFATSNGYVSDNYANFKNFKIKDIGHVY